VEGPSAPFLRLDGSIAERGDATLLYFVAVLRTNADTAAVGAAVREAAALLGRQEVQADELEGARNQVELARLQERQTARGRAHALGTAWMVNGTWRAADDDLVRVRELSAAAVRETAARLLTPNVFTSVWLMPGAR
jgi:predicted Zn-dependent peptidase